MNSFKLASRNLFRHRVRSLIALGAIGFGIVSLLLAGGFVEWIFYAMRRDTIHSLLGHIQIARARYFEEGSGEPFAYLLPEKSDLASRIASLPEVQLVAPRLSFAGLISHNEATVSFLGEGVEPEKEKDLSRYVRISQGSNLSSGDLNGVILGEGLAANLEVKAGDSVALVVDTPSGGINAVECQVRGLFYTLSKSYDEVALRLPIVTARKLLRVSGSHVWVVLLSDTEETESVLSSLKTEFSDTSDQLQWKSWQDLADFYNKTVKLYTQQMRVVKTIIALIVMLSISNTMMMNVLERTGEIGTLMALGSKPKHILRLFVSEGLLLGIFGGTAGILIGIFLAALISIVGIPMPPAPGMSHGFRAEILVTPGIVIGAFALAVCTAVGASIYPAFRASRLAIVDALRHNR